MVLPHDCRQVALWEAVSFSNKGQGRLPKVTSQVPHMRLALLQQVISVG